MSNNIYKSIASLFFVCSFFLFAQSQSITITSPASNSTFTGCSPFSVSFTSTGVSTFRYEYSLDGVLWKQIGNNFFGSPFTGAEIPFYPNNPSISIRIVNNSNPNVGSTITGLRASGEFGQNQLEFTNPTSSGSEIVVNFNGSQYLSWNANYTKCTPFVHILLSTNAGIDFPITVTSFLNNANASFTYNHNAIAAGASKAVFKIVDAYNSSNFAVTPYVNLKSGVAASNPVEITSPAALSTLTGCSAVTMNYTGSVSDYFNFEYSTDGGSSWVVGTGWIWGASTSNFTFNIPSHSGVLQTRFVKNSSPFITVTGPNYNIVNSVPQIKFTNPNINSIIDKTNTLTLTWNASPSCIPSIKIENSTDNGNTWHVLYSGSNSIYYSVQPSVLSTLPGSSLLKISDLNNASNFNVTQLVLEEPSITVNTVVGTLSFSSCPNASANISFNKFGLGQIYNFNLQYSLNGGSTWQLINSNYISYNNNPIGFTWNNIPEAVYTSTGVLVKVTEITSGLSISGSTLLNFAAKLPVATYTGVVSPTSQQPVCQAYFKPILNFCGNQDVYLTTNSGADLIPVTINANFQQFYFNFPASYDNGVNYRVVYRQSSNPTVSVMGSNFTFTKGFGSISSFNSTQQTNTANVLYVNFAQLCNISNANIDFSLDGGTSYTNYASNVPNNSNGMFSYTTPGTTTTGFRVRISSAIDPTISVTSNIANVVNPTAPIVKSLSVTSVNLSTICGNSSSITIARNYTGSTWYSLSYSTDGGASWKLSSEYFLNLSGINTTGTSTISFPFVSSNQFRVKITEQANPFFPVGLSNLLTYNTTLTSSLITMSAPSNLSGNSTNFVYYSANSNCVPFVNVYVSTNNGVSFEKLYEKSNTVGYFQWTAYNENIPQARYKIESWLNPAISVTSAAFSITPTPVAGITLTGVPAGLASCATFGFNFQHIPFTSQNFRVEMTTDGGASWRLVQNASLYGSPLFSVSNLSVGELPVNSVINIRISRSDNPSISATTTGITVTSLGVAGVEFISPISTTQYVSNASSAINLVTTGLGCAIKDVKLEYSLDNGATYRVINDKFTLINNINWYIPNGTNTSEARLRISDLNPNSVTVTSQAFNITNPFVIITVPGTVYQSVSVNIPVRYGGNNDYANFYSYYSLDNGSTWTYVNYAGYLGGTGSTSFNFTPPIVTSLTSAIIMLGNSSSIGSVTKSYLSNTFNIDRPLVGFLPTLTGANILANNANRTFNITYAGWGGNTMYWFYTFDNGATATYQGNIFLSGTNSSTITWNPGIVGSVTGVKLAFGNSSSWASSTNRYYSDEFFLTPPLLSVTSPMAGANIEANGVLVTNVVYTFSGWPSSTYYPYYTFDNGTTATRITPPSSISLNGSGTNNFNWTPPTVSTITGTRLAWGNSTNWTSSTVKFLGHPFNLIPAINNVVTVTATNATFGMCQGRQVVLTFGGSGVYNAGNRYVAEIVSSNASAVGTGYYAGEIASTLTSGVITITTPNVGYSGSWVLRVYSTAPQITNVNNLKFQGITFGSNACITANNNNALLSIDGIGTLPLAGSIAYQINTTFAGGNQFIAQLSNSIGGFNFPINIGSVTGTTAGSIPVNIPTGLATSSNYQIRVVSTNLPTTSSPTVQFTINNAYIDVWSIAGNNFCPGSNFSTIFDADGDFLTGNQFRVELSNSSGNFPTGTFIGSLSDDMGGIDLVANSTIPSSIANSNFYRVRVQSTNPFSNTSFDRESPYFRTFSSCYNTISASTGPYFAGSTLRVNITPNVTFAGGNIYIAQLSDASGSFANPQFVGSVAGTSLATITGVIPALSSAGSNFSVRVVSTNHPSTSSGFFLGNINPLQITMSPSINASGFCQEAYVKLGDLTVSGAPNMNNQYIVQMNDNGSVNFFSPFNVFAFSSSLSGIVSVPGFYIPTSVTGNGFNRSFRVISTSPSATSQNIIGTFGYNTKCFGSVSVSNATLAPNENYTVTYNLYPNVAYSAGNQFIAEVSNNGFVTVLGIGSVTSVASGVIPVSIPNTLPTGGYQLRVRATNFASTSFPENISINQVNIKAGFVDNTKSYCRGGKLFLENFSVLSAVNLDNSYVVQISQSPSFVSGIYDLTTITSAAMGTISIGELDLPMSLPNMNATYYIRVRSTSPVSFGNYLSAINIGGNCIVFSSSPSSNYCPNDASSVLFSTVDFKAGNRFTLLLSDEFGNFNSALPLNNVLRSTAGSNMTFNFTIPSGLPQGSNYKLKIASNNFVSESTTTAGFTINQACLGVPGGFNTAVSQCSFIPLVTVAANGSINDGNEYRLILTNNAGVPVSGIGLNSLLGIVATNTSGIITFENVILPTVSGTYRIRVQATNPSVASSLTNNFSITTNCLGAPFFPFNKICSGNTFNANIYVGSGNTYNTGNLFMIELSNGSGSFASPITVYSVLGTAANFSALVTIPSNMASGGGYKLRVRSTNPAFTSADGNTFTIDQVCLSAGSVAFGPYIGGSSSISIPVQTVGNVVNGTTQYSAALYNQFGTFIGNIGTPTTATTITGTLPSVSNGGYYYAIITSTNPTATSSQSNLFIVNQTGLEISTVAGSYCVGSSVLGVVFTATGSVGGGNQYALDLSDANGNFNFTYYPLGFISDNTVGVKTISGVIPIGITQSANYRLRVRASNGSISLGTPININATFEWTGAVNKDWNNVGNWSCPLLPTSNIDVVIPQIGNGNYPEINVTNAVARNMTVNTLASAFVLDNGLLSVYGNLVINGTFNSNSLGGINFLGVFNTNHDILGSGTVNLGLVTVPSFNYLNIRNTVSSMYRYYNYGYTYNYSVVNNIYEFYNYNRFEAYNNFTVINRFQNDYVFNVYNTFVSNPEFYIGNFFVNNSTFFNPAVSSFYFTGTNSFISGTNAPTFYNFYVNNGVNLSLQNIGINVCANYGNNGFFNGLGYPVSFIAAPNNVPTIISGSGFSNFGSVIFNNIYGVNVTNNIAVQNNFLNIAGFNAGTSVISFTGNGIQNVSMAGIGNLTFNGINVAETTSDLGVDANLVVQGSFTNRGRFRNNRATYFEGNAPQVISGSGYSSFNYIYNYNTFGVTILTNIVVDGNLENNGQLNAAGYTISTTGITAQTISGTNVINLGSLENTNTTGLDITQDVVVQGSFTNRGRVRGRDNTVVFGGDAVQTVVNTGTEAVFTNISVTNTVAAVNLEGSYVVNGNISNAGLLNASNTVITLSGVANQTISGTNEVVLGTVLNENTTGIVATQDVAVTGNFRNRGRFRSTETLSLEGTTAQTISGNSSLELTNVINTNITELKVETPLVVSGNIANNGVLDASTTVISTTGTAVQSITGSTVELGTLVNTNTVGGVKVEAPVEVKADIINNGSLTIDAPLTFAGTSQTISGTSAPLVQDVTVAPSSTVAVKGSFRSRGRIVNNSASTGIVAAPATTVSFEGTTKQSIEGTTPTAFANIAVQNASGIDVKQTVSATGVSLAGGNLIVDAGKSVNITSADPNAVVRTNSSYVEGTLTRVVTASGAAYTFPVGTTDAYRGVEVTFTGANNAGGIAVTPSASAPALTQPAPNGAPLALFDPNLNDTLKAILPVSWKVEAQNPSTPGDYNIALQAPVTLPGYANPAELTVVKRADENSPWVLAGDPAPVQTVTGGVKFSRRNVRSFSEYAVAGTCANVSRVSTKPGIEQVDGTFRSDMEGNNYEWTIDDSVQRVLTTRTITPRKSGRYRVRVIVSGCYSEASEYIDFTAPNGMAEIKLIETLLVYPNPAKGEFTIESETAASGAYAIEMTNSMGNTVFVKTFNFIDANKLKYTHNTESLPTGIYFIKVSNKDKIKVIKLVVQ